MKPAQITQQSNAWHLSGEFVVKHMSEIVALSKQLSTPSPLVLDFSAVTEVDTSAISFILEMQRRAEAQNSQISTVNLPDNLSSLMRLYGVETFVLQS